MNHSSQNNIILRDKIEKQKLNTKNKKIWLLKGEILKKHKINSVLWV